LEGLVKPLSFRTNWRDDARISSSVAGGLKLCRVLMLRHMEPPRVRPPRPARGARKRGAGQARRGSSARRDGQSARGGPSRPLAFAGRRVYPRPMPSHTLETVLLERDGAVLLITLNRPRQRNALNRQMWRELREAFVGAQQDPAVHVVVVTGSEGAFSAGQDLS